MNNLQKSYATLIYCFLYLPIVIVIVFSFNNASYSSLWHGFTWHWYHVLAQQTALKIAAWHSLLIGVLAASIASLLGTITATCLYRYRYAGKQLMHGLIFTLIMVPDIVIAISLLLLFVTLHMKLGFWSLLLAHITFCLPFVTVILLTRLNSLNPNLIEAARDLSASDWIILRRVILPLILPAIAAGWLLSFTLSIDDVIISYFVTGPSFNVLPLAIYSMVRQGVKPDINALCTLLFLITIMLVLLSQLSTRTGRNKS